MAQSARLTLKNGLARHADGPPIRRKKRIALYSHDTMGIGHMRRNLLIAQTLVQSELSASLLLIAGAHEACSLHIPPGVDCLTLPSIHKDIDGCYAARQLDISFEELICMRARSIVAALESFEPDLLIVDKEPRGVAGELELALIVLRAQGRTRCVLGLRDILDDPETTQREWEAAANDTAIRSYYEEVWVYGDPSVFDSVSEYRLSPAVAQRTQYLGYLDQLDRITGHGSETRSRPTWLEPPSGPFVLCMLGGGQDGVALAEAFADAQLPRGRHGVLLMGPYFPEAARDRLLQRVRQRSDLTILDFIPEPGWLLARAESVIAMGGYNSVCEILSNGKRALIVPRVRPRREQLIRAERLSQLGLLEFIHPAKTSADALSAWMNRDLKVRPEPRQIIDFSGTNRLRERAKALLLLHRPCPCAGHPEREVHHV